MLPEKINWQKLIRQLSPVLLASIALHGLALFIPVADKAPPEEPEIELPNPIPVTELPKKLPEKPARSPAPAPSFTPAPVPQPEPAPVVQPPQIIVVERDPVVEIPEAPPDPPPVDPPLPDPPPVDPLPDLPPDTPPEDTRPDPIEPQQYSSKEVTANGYQRAVADFFMTHGRDGDIETVLDLGYPANGLCFENENDLEAIIGIVFDKYGDIAASGLLKSSGYGAIDTWLQAFIAPDNPSLLPDDVFSDLQQINANAPSDGDIRDWINEARDTSKQLLPDGQDKATYYVQIAITVEENQCEPAV